MYLYVPLFNISRVRLSKLYVLIFAMLTIMLSVLSFLCYINVLTINML